VEFAWSDSELVIGLLGILKLWGICAIRSRITPGALSFHAEDSYASAIDTTAPERETSRSANPHAPQRTEGDLIDEVVSAYESACGLPTDWETITQQSQENPTGVMHENLAME